MLVLKLSSLRISIKPTRMNVKTNTYQHYKNNTAIFTFILFLLYIKEKPEIYKKGVIITIKRAKVHINTSTITIKSHKYRNYVAVPKSLSHISPTFCVVGSVEDNSMSTITS